MFIGYLDAQVIVSSMCVHFVATFVIYYNSRLVLVSYSFPFLLLFRMVVANPKTDRTDLNKSVKKWTQKKETEMKKP